MRNSSEEFIPCQKLQFSLFMFFREECLALVLVPGKYGNGKYDLKAWTLNFVADALFCVDDCCGLTDRHSSLDNHDITVKVILC